MIYGGIDYQEKYSQVEAMDKEGRTIPKARLANQEEALKRWFSSLPESCEVELAVDVCTLEGMDEVKRIHVPILVG